MPFTIAHSPDSDDAYMMAPLALGWLDPEGFDFRFVRKDIEALNGEALEMIIPNDRKSLLGKIFGRRAA